MRNFLAFTIACFAAAPLAVAQQYTGAVLYPLQILNGFTENSSVNWPQSSVTGQTVGVGFTAGGGNYAMLWSGPNGAAFDLNPANSTISYAYATDGVEQAGYAGSDAVSHAMLWSGTTTSAVDLNPVGFSNSIADGIARDQQVGNGYNGVAGAYQHALLWSGTAASVVDLNPFGMTESFAYGTDGSQQVGSGYFNSSGNEHALLWTGTAVSAVDLSPTGFSNSFIYGVAGNQQVGGGWNSGYDYDRHALLWTGTAASAVDLNPTNLAGISESVAEATNGEEQIGYGTNSSNPTSDEALLWSGTAASAVSLQPLLPTATWTDSWASSIDANGNVFGTALGTFNSISGYFAVEWSPTPEPASFAVLAVGFLGLLRRQGCAAK